jgi:hypothetical protein
MAINRKNSGRYGFPPFSFGVDSRRSVLHPLGNRLLRLRSNSETKVMSA